jgi:hypothetical protein
MKSALKASIPQKLEPGHWHLPFVTRDELEFDQYETWCKISAARCCRVSYNKVDGGLSTKQEDMMLFDKLAGSTPIHASPLEHQATPITHNQYHLQGNFCGWMQFRKIWEQQVVQR